MSTTVDVSNAPVPYAISTDKVALIRTSDRMLFKRCRRLWGWMSHLRMGLVLKEQADYFWFGTGIHFALEDYHGYNVYGHPGLAFMAFVEATTKAKAAPPTAGELKRIGIGMMCYYADYWLVNREKYTTLLIDGIPQVEVSAQIDLGVKDARGRDVKYGFTIDRMLMDEHGQYWIAEYKSAKAFRLFHLDTDEQVTAYCWAAWKIYGIYVAGVIYMQFKKAVPQMPRVLRSGKISTDSKQATTAALYKKALLEFYGSLDIVPQDNIKFLNELAGKETEDSDPFILRERVERNPTQIHRFEERVRMELEEMLNPDLALYPNQTKDCAWGCPLQTACIAMEDGSDYEQNLLPYINQTTQERESRWRNNLPKPQELSLPPDHLLYLQLEQTSQQQERPVEQQLSPEAQFLEELATF